MAGYNDLIVYQQAVVIFDLTYLFCDKCLPEIRHKRTVEQMQQATRSGKQNIVEGCQSISLQTYIKLSSVSRASYAELLEDFLDYLRLHSLKLWDKNDPRLSKVRQRNFPFNTYVAYFTLDPEYFCNLMITLINKECFMLDKLIKTLQNKFINEGGFTENLHKKRAENKYTKSNKFNKSNS